MVAANAGKAALRTIAAESASVVLLNIFYLLVAPDIAVALSYECLPIVFIPNSPAIARRIAGNIAKLPELAKT